MDYWDLLWEKIINDSSIKEEYRIAFLLNILQKICSKMNKDIMYKNHVKKLYLQSFNKNDTTKILILKEFGVELSDNDAILFTKWVEAFFKKNSKRKIFPQSFKEEIYNKQKGLCAACGQKFEKQWNKIHIDHIIPWILVGDELDDNYQALCETCNKCKSSKTDYIFKNLLNLN